MIPAGTKIIVTKNGIFSEKFFSVGDIGTTLMPVKDTSCPVMVKFDHGIWGIDPNDAGDEIYAQYGEYVLYEGDGVKAFDWADYEGKEIKVRDPEDAEFCKRILEKYNPKKEFPFICENNNNPYGYTGWKYGQVISSVKRNLEIDWSKVPPGVAVKVSNKSKEDAINQLQFYLGYHQFLGYFPDQPLPFWVFRTWEHKEAFGAKHCVIAEKLKTEWLKEH